MGGFLVEYISERLVRSRGATNEGIGTQSKMLEDFGGGRE